MNLVIKGILVCFVLIYCNKLHGQFTSNLVQLDTNKYQLIVKAATGNGDSAILTKRLPYNVFKIRQADIDNDGADEIILGVHKITHLDSIVRARINIYSVESKKITPQWLGSFMAHPLYDFELASKNNNFYIVTIEYEQNNLFLVSEYEWHSFGLKFIRYIKRNIILNEALTILTNPYENY